LSPSSRVTTVLLALTSRDLDKITMKYLNFERDYQMYGSVPESLELTFDEPILPEKSAETTESTELAASTEPIESDELKFQFV
jgi:hypothetical protein